MLLLISNGKKLFQLGVRHLYISTSETLSTRKQLATLPSIILLKFEVYQVIETFSSKCVRFSEAAYCLSFGSIVLLIYVDCPANLENVSKINALNFEIVAVSRP